MAMKIYILVVYRASKDDVEIYKCLNECEAKQRFFEVVADIRSTEDVDFEDVSDNAYRAYLTGNSVSTSSVKIVEL